MSFHSALPHAEQALVHIKGGNAAKAMHHIGHALKHLRSLTMNAGSMDPLEGRSSSGQDTGEAWAGGNKSLQGPLDTASGAQIGTPPTAKLRSRLAGLGK